MSETKPPPPVIDLEIEPEIGEGAIPVKNCGNCAAAHFPKKGDMGECRSRPPIVAISLIPMQTMAGKVVPHPQVNSAWPPVRKHQWCMKHIAIPATRH